ncbi:hypothetical protein Tco_1157499 [Tanacetum coccineum]
MSWVVQSDVILRSCDAVLDIVVTASRLSHVGVLGEGLYGEGLGFMVVNRSDEYAKGDNQRIDWVDNHIAIKREKIYCFVVESLRHDLYRCCRPVPSCCVIFDLEPLSLSFDFVFSSEIFKSFPCLSLSSLPSCDLVS